MNTYGDPHEQSEFRWSSKLGRWIEDDSEEDEPEQETDAPMPRGWPQYPWWQ
jgi:hypothetical protein